MNEKHDKVKNRTLVTSIIALAIATVLMGIVLTFMWQIANDPSQPEFKLGFFGHFVLFASHPITAICIGVMGIISVICTKAREYACLFQIIVLSIYLIYSALIFAGLILPIYQVGEVVSGGN